MSAATGWPDLSAPSAVVVVAGASLAGLTAARELRGQGFAGRLVVVGAEPHLPYDRPPLSKAFLVGMADQESIGLLVPDDDALDLEWRLGVPAAQLDTAGRRVVLADGTEVVADGVVVATGARARRLAGVVPDPRVHVLRTLDDALALRDQLLPGARVAIVGAGFIGSEVASTAVALGCDVTVVEASPAPLERVLGTQMGDVVARWHPGHGVRLLTGAPVLSVGPAADVLEGRTGHPLVVDLVGGRKVFADVVVVGAGSAPCVEWLAGSGVVLADGVRTDSRCATDVPGVVAVGDCAAVADPVTGLVTRDEHWTSATTRPAVAVETLLSRGTSSRTVSGVPYVWSEQYSSRLQFAGHRVGSDVVTVVEGDPADGPFVAVYERDGVPVAVLAVSSPRSFTRWRRRLSAAAPTTAPPAPALPEGSR